ncbi:glycosyltransferase [Burkholderiaceae bacterium]|nr:glycosyltransferase [Burkholderiaceae bacterium]
MIEDARPKLIEIVSKPLVSVVLPVYNGEEYLVDAINSILAQTFTDFELLLIDDGSTDGSPKILHAYEQRDPRVRVIVRENRGLVTTLNEAVDIARGKWVARMDQDDIALPHRLKCQLEWLKTTGADISGSWVRRFGSSDKRVIKFHQADEAIKIEILFCSPFAHPAVMMRTELVKNLRYDIACEKAEDYDLWERAAEAGWKMTNVQQVLLMYRVHAKQISSKAATSQQQVSLQIQRRYWEHFSKIKQLDLRRFDEVLKIRESVESLPNMDIVDSVLTCLIQRCDGEARDVILNHITRLYYLAAADCPDIVKRWGNFFPNAGLRETLLAKGKLWLLSRFHIRPETRLFKLFKKLSVFRLSF